MTLPASGPIYFSEVNTELGKSSTAAIYLGDAAVRTLAGVPSGSIFMSNLYGKSNRRPASFTFSTTTADASLNLSSLPNYASGATDITITINAGVYLYATSTANAGLTLTGGTAGDTLTIVNNGFIIGKGGDGQGVAGTTPVGTNPGGPALSIPITATINNTNASAYIAGGGGAGGRAADQYGLAGGSGGGAGGGNGGSGGTLSSVTYNGGAGGSPGNAGGDGQRQPNSTYDVYTTATGGGSGGGGGSSLAVAGGGGGRILPGTGGTGSTHTNTGPGGGVRSVGGNGGSANNVGGNGGGGGSTQPTRSSGGGGGWGAAGGYGANASYTGGTGGRAVALNGNSVTWVSGNTTRVYGAVS
jgi:hypothetical protein